MDPNPGKAKTTAMTLRSLYLTTCTSLILLYFAEGIVRTSTDTGMGRWLAAGETLLSVIYFCAAIGYVRLSRNRDDHK
ncbi:hypothetical protein PROAA_210014 [Candidatus Propionivibrio aalborgensis]|uniref:Uncharacterized protein n=1 Tax=Candidatus Propionivibrio aalborgensis TaxID=1860101 RepID=A0A1A8XRK2_9RHOO|nr:DUF2069 domain-containing protein [Candidatus Propionivibrio aalborgensis]SBT07107.1 hypothetical protein PROAA_210014 [Candidatus Propionivibrio aalborgensis]